MRRNGRMEPGDTSLCIVSVGVIGRFAVRALGVLFACGIIGSAIVVVITFVEDLKEVFSTNELPRDMAASVSTEHVHARGAAD
jgi:hypothetical protein